MDHDIIVIGASAGGVAALRSLVSRLPADLNAAIFIVIHLSPNRPSYLADILARCGPLPAHSPVDGEEIRPGHIYVATPDRHLLLENGRVRVSCGAKVNRMRPAVDPLFQTAALAYRDRVVGVVLTGVLDDGTAGLAAIKAMGGVAVVQDPEEAQFPDMPQSALQAVEIDYCLPIAEIAHLLGNREERVVKTPAPGQMLDAISAEAQFDLQGTASSDALNQIGQPSMYSCPDCHGVLWELRDDKLLRFRCRTGHAYTARNLLVAQVADKEAELWAALRSLEEIEKLSGRLVALYGGQTPEVDVNAYRQIAQQTQAHIENVRRLLLRKEASASGLPRQPPSDREED